MFNNPLKKYQTGGTTPSQNDIQQLIQGIAKVVNQTPEYVAKQMQQIMQTQDGETMLTEAIQEYSNNPESGLTKLKQLFPGEGAQMAKLGGKIKDFICKHAKGGYVAGCGCKEDGGKVNNNYSAVVNAPGDTTRTKQYNYRQEIMQTYPDGSVRYTTRTTGGEPVENHTWGPERRPNFLRRLWFGNKSANPETIINWRNIIANHKEDPRHTSSKENGGVVKAQLGSSGFPTYNNNTNALNEYINGVPNSGSLFSGPAVKIYIDGLDRNLVQAQEDGGVVKAQGGKKVFNLIHQKRDGNVYQSHQYGDPEGHPDNNWTYERLITPQQDTLIRRSSPNGYSFMMSSKNPTQEIVTYTPTGELQAVQDYKTRAKWTKENSFHDSADYPIISTDWISPGSMTQ